MTDQQSSTGEVLKEISRRLGVAQAVQVPPFDVGFIAGIILAGILDDWENGAYSHETHESAKRLSSELAKRICAFKASPASSTHQLPGAAMAEPTTVAADLDGGGARPNRELDSPDRGHLFEAGTVHKLKTWPEYFNEVLSGRKQFEWRVDDRDFKLGDTLVLQEYIPHPENPGREGKYTGREITKTVSYIFSPWATNKRTVVMGFAVTSTESPPP